MPRSRSSSASRACSTRTCRSPAPRAPSSSSCSRRWRTRPSLLDLVDDYFVFELEPAAEGIVELLELRVLDSQLDPEVEAAYALFAKPRPFWSRWGTRPSELERLARAQADDALLHEGIDNALKLFGDSYLARVYGIATARFRLDDYDETIQRKLTVLERIYERLADQATTRRSEFLEWIIILLIAGEIVMALA